MGFQGQAIEPSLKPLFEKNARSLHDSLCRREQGSLDDTLALLLMLCEAKSPLVVERALALEARRCSVGT